MISRTLPDLVFYTLDHRCGADTLRLHKELAWLSLSLRLVFQVPVLAFKELLDSNFLRFKRVFLATYRTHIINDALTVIRRLCL